MNHRRLLMSGLVVATLAASAAMAIGSDPISRFAEADNDNTTDTPLSSSDVRQKAVFDEQNNRVGIVKDVFDSVRRGPLAIVEVGGPSGMVTKDVAVALDQFELEPDGRLVVLLGGKDLKAMPEFTGQSAVRS